MMAHGFLPMKLSDTDHLSQVLIGGVYTCHLLGSKMQALIDDQELIQRNFKLGVY